MSNQVHYSLLHREPQTNGLREVALANGVGLLPYYPLGVGLLTGKADRTAIDESFRLSMDRYERFRIDRNFDIVDALRPFAAERDMPMAQVALGWLLAQPEVPAVTPGATKRKQIESNVRAAEWAPTREELATLDAITQA